ncbi:DUF2510 domain-containing protein [Microbacterium dauci]|uniref:DUF2510 domain-containing protein n=1 Tax=Microbacterium dauci TaxID=3048008 RepID=A0ABT6ZGV6_9MICO|nr:DUF2510 domain-containing protein [Microbacterium sp. LX3-4]MDJ1114887.1 DUF2510 domain-containing protein [Microbacterium sp. LX3-4]
MSRGAPAGWYPDPGEPGQKRWWDGSGWSDEVVAPFETIPEVPADEAETDAAPLPPAEAEPVAPERAPATPAAVRPQPAAAAEPAPTAAAQPAPTAVAQPAPMPEPVVATPAGGPAVFESRTVAPPAAGVRAQRGHHAAHGRRPVHRPAPAQPAVDDPPAPATETPARAPRPGTVWVWLAIAASVFPFVSPFVVDTVTGARLIGYFVLPPGYDPGATGWVLAGLVLLSFVNGLALAASVLFAWLDARALQRRGVERPFGWGWAVLVFVATLAVYVTGRTVVVRRRTGRGAAPFWVWLCAMVVGLTAFTLWLASFVDTLWALVATTA